MIKEGIWKILLRNDSVQKSKLAQMLVFELDLFLKVGVLPFWDRDRVPSSWYGSGSGCVMNRACSADDSGVLKASSSSTSSSSSSRTFRRGL